MMFHVVAVWVAAAAASRMGAARPSEQDGSCISVLDSYCTARCSTAEETHWHVNSSSWFCSGLQLGSRCIVTKPARLAMELALISALACSRSDSKGLAIDIGLNSGEDSVRYLTAGYDVLAVDANPAMVQTFIGMVKRIAELLSGAASAALLNGFDARMTLLSRAIAEKSGKILSFCLSGKGGVASALQGYNPFGCSRTINVTTLTCADLILKYAQGRRAMKLKVDVEGQELPCLRSLIRLPPSQLPFNVAFESPMWTSPTPATTKGFTAIVDASSRVGYTEWMSERWKNTSSAEVGWVSPRAITRYGCGIDGLLPQSFWKAEPFPCPRRMYSKCNAAQKCDFHMRLPGPGMVTKGDGVQLPCTLGQRFYVLGVNESSLLDCYPLARDPPYESNHMLPVHLAKHLNQHPCSTAIEEEASMYVVLEMNPWWGPRTGVRGQIKHSLGGYGPRSCFDRVHSYVTKRPEWARSNGSDHLHIHWYGHTAPGTSWIPNGPTHDYGGALAATSARPDWETAAHFSWVDARGHTVLGDASSRCQKFVSTIKGDFKRVGRLSLTQENKSCRVYRQDYAWKNGLALPYFDTGLPRTLRESNRGFNERKFLAIGAWGARKKGNHLRSLCSDALANTPACKFMLLGGKTEPSQAEIEALYTHSKFCVVPRGDTASSRRLQTAIFAGCVPLICSDHYVLPFPSRISWNASSLRVPEAECARTITETLPSVTAEKWSDLHAHVIRAQTPLLYNLSEPAAPGYLLDSLISESFALVASRMESTGGVDGYPGAAAALTVGAREESLRLSRIAQSNASKHVHPERPVETNNVINYASACARLAPHVPFRPDAPACARKNERETLGPVASAIPSCGDIASCMDRGVFDLFTFLGLPSPRPVQQYRGVLMQLLLMPSPQNPSSAAATNIELTREAIMAARVLRAHVHPLIYPLALVASKATSESLCSSPNYSSLWDQHVHFDVGLAHSRLLERQVPLLMPKDAIKWVWKIATFLLSPFEETLYLDTDVIVLSPTYVTDLLHNSLRVGDLVMPVDLVRPTLNRKTSRRRVIPSKAGDFVLNPPMYGRGIPPLCAGIMAYRKTTSVLQLLSRAVHSLINSSFLRDATDMSFKIRQTDQEMFWAQMALGKPDPKLRLMVLPEEYYCPLRAAAVAQGSPPTQYWRSPTGLMYPCHAMHFHYLRKPASFHERSGLPKEMSCLIPQPTEIRTAFGGR
jgi:hypothetical protein